VRVEGDVQNVIVNASEQTGFQGQVHVGGSLLGTLEVNNGDVNLPGPATAILIDGDVVGHVLVHSALDRDLVVNGAVANSGSSIVLSSALPQLASVSVSTGMHGTLDCAGALRQVDLCGVADGSIRLGDISGQVNLWNGLDGTLTAGTLIGGILGAGELYIGGNTPEGGLKGTVTLTGNVQQGAMIEIAGPAGLAGLLSLDDLCGAIHVTNDVSAGLVIAGIVDSSGAIQIDGDLAGRGYITAGAIGKGGQVQIDGGIGTDARMEASTDLLGDLTVTGNVEGLIDIGGMLGPDALLEIDGNVRESGTVLVGGSLRGELDLGWLDGAVRVGGDMAGLIDILYCIGDPDPNDVYAGHIHVIGGFEPYEGGPDPLITAFDMGAKANIVFGYDGNDWRHQWAEGAEVIISTAPYPYTENTPSAHVWMTTGCFADVNCDWRIDEHDRKPFYQALDDPWDYAATYPGLGEPNPEWDPEHPDDVPRFLSGMVLFAGDCNCDGAFNSRDTDPFEVLVLDGLCVHACGGIGRAMDVAPPEETAAAIVASVPSEAIPGAQAVIEASIPLYTDPDVQDYWATVRDNLGE
jgi:hypothetical protein